VEGSGSGLISRFYTDICLGLMQTAKTLSGWKVSWPRFEPGTSRIWSRSVNHSTTKLGRSLLEFTHHFSSSPFFLVTPSLYISCPVLPRLLVLTRSSPHLPVYYVFRCYSSASSLFPLAFPTSTFGLNVNIYVMCIY
jgi:hypothetical protein